MRLFNTINKFILVSALLLTISACKKEAVPKPSDFNKPQREYLGDKIKSAILSDDENYALLDLPNYEDTYAFLNQMYSQATNSIRIDLGAPDDDKWDFTRQWKVYIIDDQSDKICFILPGGDLFISTAFLESLSNESELFYLFSFEAALMNEQYLLNKFFAQYGTVELKKIINNETSIITIDQIALELKNLDFLSENTAEIDKIALDIVCKSSLYKGNSLQYFIGEIDNEDQWLLTRPNYTNRIETINTIIEENDNTCGSIISTGAYQIHVLEKLP